MGYAEIGSRRLFVGWRGGGPRAGQWGFYAGVDHQEGRFEVGGEATRPLAHGKRTSLFASLLVEATFRGVGPGVAAWPGLDLAVGLGPERRVTVDVGVQGMVGLEKDDAPIRLGGVGRVGVCLWLTPAVAVAVRGRGGMEGRGGPPGWMGEASGQLVYRW